MKKSPLFFPERRRVERKNISLPVALELPDGERIQGETENLSILGGYLKVPQIVLPGTKVTLWFRDREGEFSVLCRVIWLNEEEDRLGIGVGFLYPSPEVQRRLEALLL
jgi:hypothetical protein